MDTGTGIAVGAIGLALLGGLYLKSRREDDARLAAAEERARNAEALALRGQQQPQGTGSSTAGKVLSGISNVVNALGGVGGIESLFNSITRR
jgi:hypothetical protein